MTVPTSSNRKFAGAAPAVGGSRGGGVNPTAKPRGVLADDHGIFTEGLRRLLEPEYAIVAVVADGNALLHAVRALQPDFVVSDITMPLLNGIEAIRLINAEFPGVRAICLSMHADRTYVSEALDAGASAFVVKHSAAEELRLAIRIVLRGGSYVSPLVGGTGAQCGRPLAKSTGAHKQIGLTSRQRQVLQLVAEGRTVREIAKLLELSPKTVEFHKYRIIASLGLESTAAMIRYAVRHGMVSIQASR